MSEVEVNEEAIEGISARMDLRTPNERALRSVVVELSLHYDVEQSTEPFECVVVSATGIGKTYIMASLIEYLAEVRGVRNFVVIAPGKTIRTKTEQNFTKGHKRSLLGGMDVDPVVVTTENFATSSTRAAMEDSSKVKVYVLTVQSLIKPKVKSNRKAHEFQEGLGGAFYAQLQQAEDLVVLADEHHCYYGSAFSDAVRNLKPMALVGMTATPHPKTDKDSIVYRYPLAAAIAEKYVKTPVIVARKDDRADAETKLLDGVTLLRAKQGAADAFSEETGAASVRSMMLVVAQTIDEAKEYEEILISPGFDGGEWTDCVLTVNSESSDEALQALEDVEEPDSPYRIIISVGMLKEGWDVKSVHVIASMRASVSDILTEQTLGRGMRLPWGEYTGVEMLDTVDVLAHERYEQLLARADVLNKAFIDHETRAQLKKMADGTLSPERTTTTAAAVPGGGAGAAGESPVDWTQGGLDAGGQAGAPSGSARVVGAEERKKEAEAQTAFAKQTVLPSLGAQGISVPRLQMKTVQSQFSLADITDTLPFEKLGKSIASDPDREFRRTRVSARLVLGEDGMRRTILERQRAEDKIESSTPLFPLKDSREKLEEALLHLPIIPARKLSNERRSLAPLLDSFFEGLGESAGSVLSGHFGKATARLGDLITQESRKYATQPEMSRVTELVRIGTKERVHSRPVSQDLRGTWERKNAYGGWERSLYPVEWFDSKPERDVANVLDSSNDVEVWLRLHRNELPILWNDAGRQYNADFIVVDTEGVHWVLEVKADREASNDEVLAKREAAKRWVNHVNAEEHVKSPWRYLMVTETDIAQAKGSWSAIKSLGA